VIAGFSAVAMSIVHVSTRGDALSSLGRPERRAFWVVVAAITATVVLAGCTSGPTAPSAGKGDTARVAAPGEQKVAGEVRPVANASAAWVRDVEAACQYGLVMYPSLALGSGAEVDTMEYAFRSLYTSVERVPPPDDPVLLKQVSRLMTQGRDTAASWMELATRPPLLYSAQAAGATASVSMAEKRASAKDARAFILGLADAGAKACAPLAPDE